MFWVSFYSPDATMKQTVHTSSNQTESSGYNIGIKLCNICVIQQVDVLRPLLYTYVGNISILVPFFTMKLHTTTKILNFDQI